jgi:hypothetical protein
MKPVPMICPVCRAKDSYYGRLVFPDEKKPATCPNHRAVIELVPVK